ncbi:DUF1127 domain-containing protein [Pseudoroseicyclus tamaricis]|nr:hypothetical protein [Pseudoroseicyclus tamaricis]
MSAVLNIFSPLAMRLPAAAALASMHGVWLQRRALSGLDETRLADLGLTADDAACEAGRPFWDVPATWRR